MSTRAQILAEIAAQFPDNTSGLITPAKLRQVVGDVTNSCLVSETDAGTAGKAVLTAETQAQVRAAAGFGGTVTVAQLNAAGADARSAMYYCSDCLTVNGPGSLVAWCGRTSTWRTLDDCLLATTDFPAWCNDFIKNSNSTSLAGSKGMLLALSDTTPSSAFSALNGGESIVQSPASWLPRKGFLRQSQTKTNATGGTRQYSISQFSVASQGAHVFCGAKQLTVSLNTGVIFRLGLGSAIPNNSALQATEETLCLDSGNALGGLNPGLATNWLACVRSGSVNLAGSGATTATPALHTGTPQDLSVIRLSGGATKMCVNGAEVASGSGASDASRSSVFPLCTFFNDGTSTANATMANTLFCYGYLLP